MRISAIEGFLNHTPAISKHIPCIGPADMVEEKTGSLDDVATIACTMPAASFRSRTHKP
jgi:hypothetical protein